MFEGMSYDSASFEPWLDNEVLPGRQADQDRKPEDIGGDVGYLAGNLELLKDAQRLELEKKILLDLYRGSYGIRLLLRLLFLLIILVSHMQFCWIWGL